MLASPAITLDLIAERAGVSRATVSNVLHRNVLGNRADARKNIERIREIAETLGYRPNVAARAMQTRRFGAIGLLAGSVGERSVYHPFLPGVLRACHHHDLHISLGELFDQQLGDERCVPKILREWSVDGLLIGYTHEFPQNLLDIVERHRIPAIWLNVRNESDCIRPDDVGATRMATRHLIGLGHRRISYVMTYKTRHYSAADRYAGYCQAMRDAGLEPQTMYPSLPVSRSAPQLLEDAMGLLRRSDRPTAFVTYLSEQAEVICHAAARVSLAVPRDLSLVACDGEARERTGQRLTTVLIPTDQLGERAVDMLVGKIADPDQRVEPVVLPVKLASPDASAAAPPGA